jgi:hypothetical protein
LCRDLGLDLLREFPFVFGQGQRLVMVASIDLSDRGIPRG